MNPIQRRKQQEERRRVSENLEVYVKSHKIVINGFNGENLNEGDILDVFLGKEKSTFIVYSKELISQKAKLEEFGFWSSHIGYNPKRVNACDFSEIKYEIITDESRKKSISLAAAMT